MIDISVNPPQGPLEITLHGTAKVTVSSAPSSFDMAVYRTAAQHIIDRLQEGLDTFNQLGMDLPETINLDDEIALAALRHVLIVREMAVDKIISWTGFGLTMQDKDGNEADLGELPLESRFIRAVFNNFPICDAFYARMTEWVMRQLDAKKDYGTATNGRPAAAPVIAQDAKPAEAPVPAAGRD